MDGSATRWNNLFDDLEGQLHHELGAEDVDFRAEEERLRLGRLSLRDRIRAVTCADGSAGHPLTLDLAGDHPLRMIVQTIGLDWLAGDVVDGAARRHQCVVPLSGVAGLQLEASQVQPSLQEPPPQGEGLTARLGLAFVLRDLCRRRRPVDAVLASTELHGTIDRVGRDHIDFAEHAIDRQRRQSEVTRFRVIAFDRLLFVRL
jgi:hypothetical protein